MDVLTALGWVFGISGAVLVVWYVGRMIVQDKRDARMETEAKKGGKP
jgi:hypothetical protein